MLSAMLQQAITDGRKRGASVGWQSTNGIPQSDLSLEKRRKRERNRRRGVLNKRLVGKKQGKEEVLGRKHEEREGQRETEAIDGGKNIQEGTHKRRQTETLQLHTISLLRQQETGKADLTES